MCPYVHSPRIVKVGFGIAGDQRKLVESYGTVWPDCFGVFDPVLCLERPGTWEAIRDDAVTTTSLSAIVQSVFGAPLVGVPS